MGAQEPLVRITLLEPYAHSEDGRVTISGGQVSYLDSIATHISINPADPAFQQPFNKDENVLAYGRREGPIEQVDLHQTVVYELSMNPGEETTLLPIGTAKTHFGDWDIKPGGRSAVNPRQTYAAEQARVAMNWGDYERFPYVRRSSDGKILADTRIIAPPKVPKVRIDLIDQRGNLLLDDQGVTQSIDPWAFYHWETMVDKQAAAEARRRQQDEGYVPQPAAVAPATMPDIAALVEAEVSKRLAKKAAHA